LPQHFELAVATVVTLVADFEQPEAAVAAVAFAALEQPDVAVATVDFADFEQHPDLASAFTRSTEAFFSPVSADFDFEHLVSQAITADAANRANTVAKHTLFFIVRFLITTRMD
jgi:hypothetical protein